MLKSFIKRFLLILFGILLSLAVLELSIRFAGFIISNYQNYRNTKVLKKKSKYTIMCIGESTTFRQYPIQLQKILDKKYPNKFSVIDCGIPGTNLETILDMLNDNIKKYNPDIAICMMGINDYIILNQIYHYSQTEKKEFYKNIKVYKLFIFLEKYLTILFANECTNNEIKLLDKYYFLKEHGKFFEAEQVLKVILQDNSNNEQAFGELAVLYFNFIHKPEKGYDMAIKAINLNFHELKERYYKIIFEYNKKHNNIKELQRYTNKAINEDINIFRTSLKYTLYGFISDIISNEQRKKILSMMSIKNDIDCGIYAIEMIKQKKYKEATKYFQIAENFRSAYCDQIIYKLYNLLITKLINKNIKIICMQYPVRGIQYLKNILKDESYYDKITFISNEHNFKEALMTKQYDEIFTDQFAGDFGHCTDLGNTMIAENVANILEKLIN